MIQSGAKASAKPLSAKLLHMLLINWEPQRYRWEFLKTIRLLSGVMNRWDFIVSSGKRPRVMIVCLGEAWNCIEMELLERESQ